MTDSIVQENNRRLGRRLFSLRTRALQKTQLEMAEVLRIAPRTYQNYERGEREIASSTVRDLHQHFAVDPIWLLQGEDDTPVFRRGEQTIALFVAAILLLEERILISGVTVTPAKKADLIELVCRHHATKDVLDVQFIDRIVAIAAV
ncbi:transcriptional regulator with XRE-family HTH domain [Brevundimonas nasdae]|uniref:helix-turn-helix domain-containing protein n=1 Tax=Brevundimonas nasdae TaxID=172043 RepID=UPI001914CF53|nr:helix-turn-helix transcriptional regulator [Brevundimonas nasdae]MBK6026838.1 helix-turn-helix transcriptional regulator [Brevundimonas nasdae]MDQ0453354.1 transcriptional regulator with XRE-family HTH domain [Brevundimonas nasdae]